MSYFSYLLYNSYWDLFILLVAVVEIVGIVSETVLVIFVAGGILVAKVIKWILDWGSRGIKQCKPGALDDPEGWDGEEGGRSFDGEHVYTHGWFMSMYSKNHYNTIISLQLK